MQRTSFLSFECPAARALESVGDWWSILILRDAFQGLKRFDEFQQSLGVSTNILSRRLKHLTSEGLFERHQYMERPPRYEYILTPKGRDFYPVAIALFAWGNRHLPSDQIAMHLGNRATGEVRQAIVVDADTGERITPENTVLLPGPAATEQTLQRIGLLEALQSKNPTQTD
ncbi:winged helix-turn-helix transcriptional regulator [Zooshikella sp. RANM57]|uniref:winged helix-turn-helix transcriptional regulator n=1 Tax=Zooshikella sp. RANM57 TaxID=3425863 RepID=UPI003D6DAC15